MLGIPKYHSVQRLVSHWFSPTQGLGLMVGFMAIIGSLIILQPTAVQALPSAVNRLLVQHQARAVCANAPPPYAHCLAEVSLDNTGHPLVGIPSATGSYGPVQFHTAYNLPCTPGGAIAAICGQPGSFGPTTIAIVDAGNFSSGTAGLESSLQTYDQYYGLPSCTISNGCLNVVNQTGAASPLPADAGWSNEIALDVEAAHMICQTCKIVLVEASTTQVNDLASANTTAASFNPIAISNSWGATADTPSLDTAFKHSGIAVIASTGDAGTVSNGAAWPSDIPEVIGVAGTSLQLHADSSWSSESLWANSGGGCSTNYAAPSWQTAVTNWSTNGCGSYRSFGDMAADGDPNTGAAIAVGSTWYQFGGTSLAAPLIAGMFALTGGTSTSATVASLPYAAATSTNFHDISTGSDCTTTNLTHCTALAGFDTPTGLGSPNGLSGFEALPGQPTNLTATTISQTTVDLNWTASVNSTSVTGYNVYRNNVKLTTVTGTSYNDTGLTPNASYQYSVAAVSNQGSYSLTSGVVTAIASYPADINQDGHINLLDLSLLASHYNQTNPTVARTDINRDGTVNLLDLSILAAHYGSE